MPLSIHCTRCSSVRLFAVPVPARASATPVPAGCLSTHSASVRFVPSLLVELLPFDQISAAAAKSGFAPAPAGSSSARIAATSLPMAAFELTSDAGA